MKNLHVRRVRMSVITCIVVKRKKKKTICWHLCSTYSTFSSCANESLPFSDQRRLLFCVNEWSIFRRKISNVQRKRVAPKLFIGSRNIRLDTTVTKQQTTVLPIEKYTKIRNYILLLFPLCLTYVVLVCDFNQLDVRRTMPLNLKRKRSRSARNSLIFFIYF